MELGSGIALAGLCVSGGAVMITAIRTYAPKKNGVDGVNGINGKNGVNGHDSISFPCKEHSGIVVSLSAIKESQTRQEKWLSEISSDVRRILEKK